MSETSVFTKIINREIPSEIVFENDRIIIIKNIKPQAPIHLLGITKQPFKNLDELLEHPDQKELLWELMSALKKAAHDMGTGHGYRFVVNNGEDGGQSVFHLHIHLLGGTKLSE